jgi:hypothetical protein
LLNGLRTRFKHSDDATASLFVQARDSCSLTARKASTRRTTSGSCCTRLPEQPIFYPVLDVKYAAQIARSWNAPAYGAGSGKRLRIERLASLEDLDARIDQLRKSEPGNLRAWLPLMYYRSVLNGQGKLDELMNDRYPSIRPTTVPSSKPASPTRSPRSRRWSKRSSANCRGYGENVSILCGTQ